MLEEVSSIQDAIRFLDGDSAQGYIGIAGYEFGDDALTAKGKRLYKQLGGKCRRDGTINLKKHSNIKAFLHVADQGENDEWCSLTLLPAQLAKYWSVDDREINEDALLVDLLLTDRSIATKEKAREASRKVQEQIYTIEIPHRYGPFSVVPDW